MANFKRWAVADCETDAFDGAAVSPFIWGYKTSDGTERVCWDTSDFIVWLKNFDGVVYAHNGGKFDWLQSDIIHNLNEGKIRLINSRLAEAKIGAATIRDSWLCVPAALDKFGEKDNFDYKIVDRAFSRSRAKNKSKIEKYLKQDCAALYNVMEKFISQHGFALTLPGAALKCWEKMGGTKRRYGQQHDHFFRPYYSGGRCEVFEYANGIEGEFFLYDINSSYPAAMSSEHTCGVEFYDSTNYKKAHPSSFWIIEGVSRGALPYRDEKNRLYFPSDNSIRTYYCTGHEIRAALEFGALDIISAHGLIPREFETFKPYVDRFSAERAEAKKMDDKVGEQIAKTFANSLYGKYGANPDNYRDYKIVPAGVREDGWEYTLNLAEYDVLECPTPSPQYFDVAVAASITGQARATLLRGILSSKRVMYCDTDSVLCEKFAGEIGDKLGQWKLEAEVKKVWIAGKKCYALETTKKLYESEKIWSGKTKKYEDKIPSNYKIAHKGISKLDIQIDDIKRAAAGEVVNIIKSAPNCKLDGRQVFFNRRIKKT